LREWCSKENVAASPKAKRDAVCFSYEQGSTAHVPKEGGTLMAKGGGGGKKAVKIKGKKK